MSNAFAKAPPPKQGFYIHPNKAYVDWWINHKQQDHILPNVVRLCRDTLSPPVFGKNMLTLSSARLAFSKQHMNLVSI